MSTSALTSAPGFDLLAWELEARGVQQHQLNVAALNPRIIDMIADALKSVPVPVLAPRASRPKTLPIDKIDRVEELYSRRGFAHPQWLRFLKPYVTYATELTLITAKAMEGIDGIDDTALANLEKAMAAFGLHFLPADENRIDALRYYYLGTPIPLRMLILNARAVRRLSRAGIKELSQLLVLDEDGLRTIMTDEDPFSERRPRPALDAFDYVAIKVALRSHSLELHAPYPMAV